MKFSIIVPVYNTEAYVGACIQSVLTQTYQNFELILVNDGSTDRSGDICEEYAVQDPRIQVFHKSNSGQMDTRRYGMQHAVGDYVLFLDSDDLFAKNALDVLCQKFDQYQCDMVVYSAARFIDRPPCLSKEEIDDILIDNKNALYNTLLTSERYNSLCLKAIRRTFLSWSTSTFSKDVRYGEDLLETLSVIRHNPITVIIGDALYYYRTNPNSVTHSLQLDRYASDIVYVRNAVYEFLKEEKVLTAAQLHHYKGFSARLLAEGIANIARTKSTFEHKKELLDNIKESHYYKDFLCAEQFDRHCLGNKRIVWFLFEKGFYRPLFFLFWIKRLSN